MKHLSIGQFGAQQHWQLLGKNMGIHCRKSVVKSGVLHRQWCYLWPVIHPELLTIVLELLLLLTHRWKMRTSCDETQNDCSYNLLLWFCSNAYALTQKVKKYKTVEIADRHWLLRSWFTIIANYNVHYGLYTLTLLSNYSTDTHLPSLFATGTAPTTLTSSLPVTPLLLLCLLTYVVGCTYICAGGNLDCCSDSFSPPSRSKAFSITQYIA